jgi:hypothetical protein
MDSGSFIWSPHCHKSWLNIVTYTNTCAYFTGSPETLRVGNPQKFETSWGGMSCPVLIWWSWQRTVLTLPTTIGFLTTRSVTQGVEPTWASLIHFPANAMQVYWKSCTSEFPAIPRIPSVGYEFPNRKWFPSGMHSPVCSNLLLAPPPLYISPASRSVRCLPQPVLQVSGAFCYFLCDCADNFLPFLQPEL